MNELPSADHRRSNDNRTANGSEDSLDIGSALARGAIALTLLVAATAALGAIGTSFVFDSAIGTAETDLVAWLADHRNAVLDTVAKVGAVTDTWTAIGVMFGSMTILVAIGRGRLALLIIVAMGLELATFLIVGALIDRPRPEVDAIGAVPSTPSFPSGHAAGTVALYGSLMLAARRVSVPGRVSRTILIVLPLIAAVLVAASRVYDGVHYPSDVIVGLLMGAGAVAGAIFVTDLTDEFRDEWSSNDDTSAVDEQSAVAPSRDERETAN